MLEFLNRLFFVNQLYHFIGLLYLYIRNRGKKSFKELLKEEPFPGHLAGKLILGVFLIIVMLGALSLIGVAIYSAIVHGIH